MINETRTQHRNRVAARTHRANLVKWRNALNTLNDEGFNLDESGWNKLNNPRGYIDYDVEESYFVIIWK